MNKEEAFRKKVEEFDPWRMKGVKPKIFPMDYSIPGWGIVENTHIPGPTQKARIEQKDELERIAKEYFGDDYEKWLES